MWHCHHTNITGPSYLAWQLFLSLYLSLAPLTQPLLQMDIRKPMTKLQTNYLRGFDQPAHLGTLEERDRDRKP